MVRFVNGCRLQLLLVEAAEELTYREGVSESPTTLANLSSHMRWAKGVVCVHPETRLLTRNDSTSPLRS